MEKLRLEQRQPFLTADGSSIRELVGIPSGNAIQQSVAEATVPPGGETVEHSHRTTEEVYVFVGGEGRMLLGEEQAPVCAGDTVVIFTGDQTQALEHGLRATGPAVLLRTSVPRRRHGAHRLTPE
jgi:mannose-6-phosphate isomerase-like protein (cupin superfamily)